MSGFDSNPSTKSDFSPTEVADKKKPEPAEVMTELMSLLRDTVGALAAATKQLAAKVGAKSQPHALQDTTGSAAHRDVKESSRRRNVVREQFAPLVPTKYSDRETERFAQLLR